MYKDGNNLILKSCLFPTKLSVLQLKHRRRYLMVDMTAKVQLFHLGTLSGETTGIQLATRLLSDETCINYYQEQIQTPGQLQTAIR